MLISRKLKLIMKNVFPDDIGHEILAIYVNYNETDRDIC